MDLKLPILQKRKQLSPVSLAKRGTDANKGLKWNVWLAPSSLIPRKACALNVHETSSSHLLRLTRV
jgi:hypothetical protein